MVPLASPAAATDEDGPREDPNSAPVHQREVSTGTIALDLSEEAGSDLAPRTAVECRVDFSFEATYERAAVSFRTQVRGEIDAVTRCTGTTAEPVVGSIRTQITDQGTPVFGSPNSDSADDSGAVDVPLLAIAQTDTPVYRFPATVHGIGSLYLWDFQVTIQSGSARDDVCLEFSAIDPGSITGGQVPC